MPDLLLSSLFYIVKKVRRLTRTPSESQLSSISIGGYIDNFILYDMPAHVKLDSLKTTFTFYTIQGQSEYETSIGVTHINDTFYHFKDYYTNVTAPVYISGERAIFTQSMEEFYNIYPQPEYRESIGTGNGVTTLFAGTIANTPLLKSHFSISTRATNDDRLLVKDNGSGTLTGDTTGVCTIDYDTGVYSFSFSSAPKLNEDIWVHYVAYTASKPDTILFFNDKIIVRPVPDDAYRIDLTVHKRPSEMLLPTAMPELSEWWEYIAYGSSIKVLQDRLDFETVELLRPEFERQEILINRRKIMQNSSKRTPTLFATTFEGDE